MKRSAFFLFGIACLAASIHAQFNPPAGGDDIIDLRLPAFIAGGAHVTTLDTPQAGTVNPAASALNQRITLDLSYAGLIGVGTEPGWNGHGINLGAAFPTKYGVLSTTFNFMNSSFQSVATGTFVSIGGTFAKALYPDLLAGAGLNLTLGGKDVFDWGLSADLGIIHFVGDLSFMKDFRWGAALQRLGKWYAPVSGNTGFPSPFTPTIGAAFTLFTSPYFTMKIQSDASLPSFQNFRWNLGSSLSFKDIVTLDAGLRFDVGQLIAPTGADRSLIPSIGLSFNFKTDLKEDKGFIAEHGWNRSEVRPSMAVTPFMNDVWAFGLGVTVPLGVIDTNPPEITLEYADGTYLSPNTDGKSDDIVIPVKLNDERYITGYALKIMKPDGTLVREIRNKDERPENTGLQNIMNRITAVKQGISVPESIRWDGTANDGSVVPDGSYTFVLEAVDDNGNTAVSPSRSIHIDRTLPDIALKSGNSGELIFSPNGDGNKDGLTIKQTGSAEDLWQAELVDARGTTVKTFVWQNAPPSEITWDGMTDSGIPAPDGVYSYVIRSTDRAQNSASASIENIIVNTEQTPIQVAIDNSYFSPNRDNVYDEITFTFDIPVRSGIDNWELAIRDESGTVQRTYADTGEPPMKISFDGQGDRGNNLIEGKYKGDLKVRYRNGNSPEESSPFFTLDMTPPQVSINIDNEVFSPNGDGNKDKVTIYQETSREDHWQGTISTVKGAPVKTFTWYGNANPSISWDGRSDNGMLLPDGTYEYSIRATDKAGNTGTSRKAVFNLNTEETPVILSADLEAFSPNADGVADRIRIIPQLRVADGITSYEVRITDESGKIVKTFAGRNRIDNSFSWDGISTDGKRCADGQYKAEISILYDNGNQPRALSGNFNLDTDFPRAVITADRTLFSSDGDGKKDSITFSHEGSREEVWEGRIVSSGGKVVRNYFWKGTVPTLTWDGKDEAGNPVDDGTYRYELTSTDKAGNTFKTVLDRITVDTRPARVFITVDTIGFSPNGDKFAEEVQFTPYISLKDGIENWSLKLVRENGVAVKEFAGTSSVPASIKWDGRSDSGSFVEGTYKAILTVSYKKGNEPSAETTLFILDLSAPKVKTVISPKPFSPDNDGIDDELKISLDVKDTSEIRDWSFRIFDPTNRLFREYAGKGVPGDIIWDGRALNGELVQAAEDYPYVFTATDILGNTATEKGLIPIDVLVIRDGDKLKIRISSINFAPNSPGLNSEDAGQMEKNTRVLKRLAEILNKYGRYKIRIEGHAVRVFWNDPVKAAKEEQTELMPLSLARAETVKSELVRNGVDPARISTAGLGGNEPVVPHDDVENRWKNRRVEFILIR